MTPVSVKQGRFSESSPRLNHISRRTIAFEWQVGKKRDNILSDKFLRRICIDKWEVGLLWEGNVSGAGHDNNVNLYDGATQAGRFDCSKSGAA